MSAAAVPAQPSSAHVAPAGHHEDVDVVGRRWRAGVLLLIVADAAFVASLLFSYLYLRGLDTEHGWLPAGVKTATVWSGWALTLGFVLSLLAFRWGQRGIAAGDGTRLVLGSVLAVVILLLDTVGQVVVMTTFPFHIADGAYASCMYALAGANVFHQLLTLFIGIGIWNRARIGKYTAPDSWQVRLAGYWWLWVTIAAVATSVTTAFTASPHA